MKRFLVRQAIFGFAFLFFSAFALSEESQAQRPVQRFFRLVFCANCGDCYSGDPCCASPRIVCSNQRQVASYTNQLQIEERKVQVKVEVDGKEHIVEMIVPKDFSNTIRGKLMGELPDTPRPDSGEDE